jgi:hypothetical protein
MPWSNAAPSAICASIEKIGEADPRPWPAGDRPLAGLRVLDLSRVIAGPVAGRTLAAHGADVMLICGPDLPAIPWLTIDTGRGKLTSFVDLKTGQGHQVLRGLLAEADIFSQGYLMAFGAMMARARQSREGGSWHVQVSLARTGRWLWELGRIAGGFGAEDPARDAIMPLVEEAASGFGPLRAVRHAALLSRTPAL